MNITQEQVKDSDLTKEEQLRISLFNTILRSRLFSLKLIKEIKKELKIK